MKLIYNNPGELTIAQYLKTLEIFKSDLTDLQKQIEILAIYTGESVDNILHMSPEVVGQLSNEMVENIANYKPSHSKRPKKIKINDETYKIDYKLDKLNMAQYVDFQQTITKPDYIENLSTLLSIFIIPKGHTYNDNYDILYVRNLIENNITLDEALSINFFLRTKSTNLIKDKLRYCKLMLKIMKWTTKDKETKEHLEMAREQLLILENNLIDIWH